MQQRTQLIPESTGGLAQGCGLAILITFMIIFAGFFIGPAIAGVYGLFHVASIGFISLVIGASILGIPIFFIVRWLRLRRYLAQRVQPTVVASNHPLQMGERFTVDCTFPLQNETEILAGTMMLILRESATYETGMGTQRRSTTVTHDHNFGVCLIPHIAATNGTSHNLSWNSGIPITAMHTFEASDNKIRWYVAFDMQVRVGKRTRKYATRYPMLVLPQIVGA